MAGVDLSIYGQISPPPDPFAIPNKLIGLQQSAIENQLLGRSLEGQQVRQQALGDAYDPQTGQFDVAKYHAAVQGTPAALSLPEDIQSGQKIRGTDIANTGASLDLGKSQGATLGVALGGILNGGGPVGVKQVRKVINDLMYSGQLTPMAGGSFLHTLPTDDAGVRAWANHYYQRTIPNASEPQQLGVDPLTKAPIMGTRGQATSKALRAVPGDDDGATDTTATPQPPVRTPTASAKPPAVAAKSGPSMGFVAGPSAGALSAADVAARESAGQFAALRKASDATSGTRATLSNMQDFLRKAYTGPYADQLNTAKAGANSLADVFGLPEGIRFNPETIAAAEEYKKSAAQLIQQYQQALGGTDAGFASGRAASPNIDYSKLGNRRIIQMLQGMQDAVDAKSAAAESWLQEHGPDTYGEFIQQFNKKFSPRAFQWVRMDPDQQQEALKTMSEQDLGALKTAIVTAHKNHWLKPSAGTPSDTWMSGGTSP